MNRLRRQHRRHRGLLHRVVRELRGMGVQLHPDGIYVLLKQSSARQMWSGRISMKPFIEASRCRLQVRGEAPVSRWQVFVLFILFLIHLLASDILFRDSQCATGALLVYLRCPSGRFNTCVEITITAPRSRNVSSASTVNDSGRSELTILFLYLSRFSSRVLSVLIGFVEARDLTGGIVAQKR